MVGEGDIVTIFDEGQPRSLWRLGQVQEVVSGSDGVVRGVCMKVASKKGQPRILRRPLQHVHPLEVSSDSCNGSQGDQGTPPDPESLLPVSKRPTRRAAEEARSRITHCLADDHGTC